MYQKCQAVCKEVFLYYFLQDVNKVILQKENVIMDHIFFGFTNFLLAKSAWEKAERFIDLDLR